MTDVNKPDLIWIDGRCHRINPTTDKANIDLGKTDNSAKPSTSLGAYQEVDKYESDDRDYSDIQLVNGKFTCSLQVPSALHSRIIGAKGATRKRLEYETKCQVTIPRMGSDGPVEVTGGTQDDVVRCRQRIEMILSAAKKKMKPTHFIGVPFQSEALLEKYAEFKEAFQKCPVGGLTEDMFTSPAKLHVTFNVMILLDEEDRTKATTLFKKFHEEHIQNNDKYKNMFVTVTGLNSFQANKLNKCYVLYAEVHSEALQELGDSIYSYFIQNELSFKEHGRDTVKMHMTLVKGSGGKSFDCEQAFNELRTFEFGTLTVSEIHLSQMSTVDSDTGYYKATSVLPL